MKINYFGSSISILKSISVISDNILTVCEERSVSAELINYCNDNLIELVIVNKENLSEKVNLSDLGFSYGFGLIFSADEIKKHRHGIINFHCGNFELYRGRHPIGWAIIEGQKNIIITAHRINSKIDSGEILSTLSIGITEMQTEREVAFACEKAINKNFLEKAFKNLITGNYIPAEGGRYLPPLAGKFEKIQSADYSKAELINIFRAKQDHCSITVNDTEVLSIMKDKHSLDKDSKIKSFLCKDGMRIELLCR